jgi:hypothetical protein
VDHWIPLFPARYHDRALSGHFGRVEEAFKPKIRTWPLNLLRVASHSLDHGGRHQWRGRITERWQHKFTE